ncbi:MAG TPA: NAD(P)/FAD-dependent oxidoreductase [Pirellulaceae bacterium]|nr:NAD(P)/FAD-dependent oxidoreductase [Pirellulaceae bacterium]
MNNTHFDVIVLGTGPAGSTIARKAAKSGRRVAIVESREFGGTCALRGCNPKKVYVNAASLVDQVRRSDGKLVVDPGVKIDWPTLLTFKKEFTEPVATKSEKSFQDDGITTIHGQSTFCGIDALTVDDRRLSAERIVVATGATPAPLEIPGADCITHSDEFMELASIPERVLFIGGGYISMEFSHVVARCGKQVTVVNRHPHVLSGFDPDLVQLLQTHSTAQGIAFRHEREVVGIELTDNGERRVSLDNGDSIVCDLVVHGAGRVPNIAALQLDEANIQHNSKGIIVDRFMQSSSNPHVFAAGDCAASGAQMLTPTANEEARIVASNLFADDPEAVPDYGKVPKVVFTVPAIASVGMSEQEARDAGHDIDVRFKDTSQLANAA